MSITTFIWGKYAAVGVVAKSSRVAVAGSPQTKGIDPDRAWQKGGAGPEKSLTDGKWQPQYEG